MNKIFLFLTFTLFCCSNVKAQDIGANITDTVAEIWLESDTVDYGTIENNADGNRQLKFTNTGKAPLVISQCFASCGCTVPQWPTNAIPPGEGGILNIRYNTSKIGPINGTITIHSNASIPQKTIALKGHIEFKNAPEIANHEHSKDAKTFSFFIGPNALSIDSVSSEFVAMIEHVKQKTKSKKSTSITIESSSSFNPEISYEANYDTPKKRAISTSKLIRSSLRKQGIIYGTYYKEPVILVQGSAKDFKKKKKSKKYQYVKVIVD